MGTHWGKGTIGLQAAVPKKPHTLTLTFFLTLHIGGLTSTCNLRTRHSVGDGDSHVMECITFTSYIRGQYNDRTDWSLSSHLAVL